MITPDTAGALLLATGRAESKNGSLIIDLTGQDTIGRTAIQIVLRDEPADFYETAREVTGREPALDPKEMGDMIIEAVCPKPNVTPLPIAA